MTTPTQAPAAKEGLLPCPFCKSVDIDPKGWLAGDGSFGPQCMTCGATAESKEKWNTRPTSASDAEKERKFMDLLDNPAPPNDALKNLLNGASRAVATQTTNRKDD